MIALCIILAAIVGVLATLLVGIIGFAHDVRKIWVKDSNLLDAKLREAHLHVDCMMNELEEIDMLLMSAQRDGADPQETIERIAAIRTRDEQRTRESHE